MSSVLVHPLPPFVRADSTILILGSFPSPKSRETGFFYGHPQNRFWKVLARVYGEEVPQTIAEKERFLERHCIALWDVAHSCRITGASDASMREVVPNDINRILQQAPIRQIFCTGKQSYTLYQRLCEPQTHRPAIALPSTSPANCRMKMEELAEAYRIVRTVSSD